MRLTSSLAGLVGGDGRSCRAALHVARNSLYVGSDASQGLTFVVVEWSTGKVGIWHGGCMGIACDRCFSHSHMAMVVVGRRCVAAGRRGHERRN